MELKTNGNTIGIIDGDNSFEIFQAPDNDIWFMSSNPNITSIINYRSRNQSEWRTAEVFGNLMRAIIGHSILEPISEYSHIPKDFIDTSNKTITWHSDNGTNNTLKILYSERNIIISITKNINEPAHTNNGVRIRTSGSNYENYDYYFTRFYRELLQLAHQINSPQVIDQKAVEEQPNVLQKRKGFSLFPKK